VVALDAADGTEVWRREGGDPHWGLVVTDESVVVGDEDGVRTHALADGTDGWRTDAPGRPVAGTGETLYLSEGRRGREVVARSLVDGSQHWEFRTPDVQVRDVIRAGVGGMASAGEALYVHAADGLHGLRAAN
jgi:outer membrane protein assembly factor BamB